MSSTRSLDRSLVQGIAWTGGIKWLTQIVSWGATLLVVRLLTPGDYGLVGMALIYMGLGQIVSDAGLAAVIIQKRDLSDDQISRLQGLSVLLGVALFAVTLGVAEPMAWFFAEPDLRPVMLCFSLTFLTRSVGRVPRELMARDLQFRRVALVDGVETISLMVVTLSLALAHAGHWALVLGSLGSSIATTVVSVWLRPQKLTIPRTLEGVAGAVTFGWHVVTAQLAWYAYSNADFAVVGRVLGKAALGTYSLAWTIASIPVDRVSGLVGRVTPSYFAAVQHDAAALRRYLLNVTEALALVTMPACIGLAIVADDFVHGVLGPSWSATATPLRLLAIYAAFRSVFTPGPQILIATGHARLSMHFSILAMVILPTALYIGSFWGTAGVAMGWIVAYPAIAIGFFLRSAFRIIELKTRHYLEALTPALIATLGMCLTLFVIRTQLPADWSAAWRLAAQVAAGAAAYGGIVLAIHGTRLRAIRALLRSAPGVQEPHPPAYDTGPAPGPDRLLLVTWHFPPDPAVGALRWQKLARLAVERGWGLDVIALDPRALRATDASRLRDLPAGVRVYGVPPARTRIEVVVNAVWAALRFPVRPLMRAMGLATVRGQPQTQSIARADMRWWPREPRDILRGYAAWLEYARYRRWAREVSRLAMEVVTPETHKAVITCGPPHAAHIAGVEIHLQSRLPLIVDLRDPWSLVQRLPEGTASPVWLALAHRWERFIVEHANLVVTNTQQLRNAMGGRYPAHNQRMIPVLNGFDDDPIPELRPRDRFIVGYTGSIYLDRDPRPLFRAAHQVISELDLAPWDFSIELMGSVQTYDGVPLMQIAVEERIAEFVMLHRARPRHEAFEFLARASLLIALPQDSDMAIPAKIFDYMRFDSWILAIASRDSATAVLLRDTRADVVAPDDFSELVAVLRKRFLQFRKGFRARPLARDARFSRRSQSEVLFTAIERIAGVPSLEKECKPPETRAPGWRELAAGPPAHVSGAPSTGDR